MFTKERAVLMFSNFDIATMSIRNYYGTNFDKFDSIPLSTIAGDSYHLEEITAKLINSKGEPCKENCSGFSLEQEIFGNKDCIVFLETARSRYSPAYFTKEFPILYVNNHPVENTTTKDKEICNGEKVIISMKSFNK